MTEVTHQVTDGDTETGTGLWVPIAELARMRGLARQVMYRKVDRLAAQGALEIRTDERGAKLVSPAQYDRIGRDHADLAREMGAGTRRQPQARPSSISTALDPGGESSSATYTREQARLKAYQADLAEMDLKERRGELTPTAEVIEAAREAVSAMTQAFDLALADTAERLAAATGKDARAIRPHLRTFKDVGLAAFRHTLTTALAAGERAPAAPDA